MSKPKAERRYVIDSSPWAAVVICQSRGCPWRAFSHGKPSAYRQVADHLVRAHGDLVGARDARQSAANYQRRLAATNTRDESLSA